MDGLISASLIVVILTAIAVGALTGLILGDVVTGVTLALISAVLANLVAAVVRYVLLYRFSGAGSDEAKIPTVILVNGLIAAVAGGLAGHTLAIELQTPSPVWVGLLSGLVASILMALLMITYHHNRPR